MVFGICFNQKRKGEKRTKENRAMDKKDRGARMGAQPRAQASPVHSGRAEQHPKHRDRSKLFLTNTDVPIEYLA
jgi:hypothetical protein